MEIKEKYSSKDFYTSAIIMATGNPLQNLKKLEPSGSTYFFVFDISTQQAEAIIDKHWSRKLTVHSRDLIDAIKELKTRIYEGR